MDRGENGPSSERKISETLLEFARPLIDSLGPGATCSRFEQVLVLAVSAWNASVMAASGELGWVVRARAALASAAGPARELFEALLRRKREYYASDLRIVGAFKIIEEGGGTTQLWAEARSVADDESSRTPPPTPIAL
jgi:hypothetical protein